MFKLLTKSPGHVAHNPLNIMYTIGITWTEVVRRDHESVIHFPTKKAAREFVEAMEDGETAVLEDHWEEIYDNQDDGMEQESEPDEYTVEVSDQTCLEEDEAHA